MAGVAFEKRNTLQKSLISTKKLNLINLKPCHAYLVQFSQKKKKPPMTFLALFTTKIKVYFRRFCLH